MVQAAWYGGHLWMAKSRASVATAFSPDDMLDRPRKRLPWGCAVYCTPPAPCDTSPTSM